MRSRLENWILPRRGKLSKNVQSPSRPLQVLANGCQEYLLSLGIQALQPGSIDRVDIDFPGKGLVSVRKARRERHWFDVSFPLSLSPG